jgi:hypothetical protein
MTALRAEPSRAKATFKNTCKRSALPRVYLKERLAGVLRLVKEGWRSVWA